MKVYLSTTTNSRAMPVVKEFGSLFIWTSTEAREPDEISDNELDEVIQLVATGSYRFARTN